MASPDMAKPAREVSAEPVSGSESLPSSKQLGPSIQPLIDWQVRWIARRFSVSSAMAWAVAPLVFGEARA